MRFDSRLVCEFECDTSKDNGSFATLSLSSTIVCMHCYCDVIGHVIILLPAHLYIALIIKISC